MHMQDKWWTAGSHSPDLQFASTRGWLEREASMVTTNPIAETGDRIQTELADMHSLSFVNSTFFTTYLVTNSHWSREDPEQERRRSEKDVLCGWVSQFPLVPWYHKIIVVFTTWYIQRALVYL